MWCAACVRIGYDNTQRFERAFCDVFGVTPVAFRKVGVPDRAPLILRTGDDDMFDVKTMDAHAQWQVGLEHTGPCQDAALAFEQDTAPADLVTDINVPLAG